MFAVKKVGFLRRPRLIAGTVLMTEEFDAIAKLLDQKPARVRKITGVAACRVQEPTTYHIRWQGEESVNKAEPGDWIVTNLDARGEPLCDIAGNVNRYVITSEAFPQLYERAVGETEYGPMFKVKGIADALALPGGLDIAAPWGERQTIKRGYLLRNGPDIYGNDSKSFRETYQVVQ